MAGKKRDKERERAFYENGSILHEKLIATCNGRPIPIRSYSCEELPRATNNYDPSRIFHVDGFYKWYNGSFEGRMISIKKSLRHRGDDIFTDIAVSAKMSTHINVLKLIGCCLETQVPISVYESAANGSLSSQLFNVTSDHDGAQQHQREPLSWQSRLKIAREIAHAISYLHTAFSRPIVHRDIKPGNVFLDQNDVAKLTDFSLSISIPEGETHVEDDVCGTFNFVCPRYHATGYITEKVDVYSFGSFLLELLTGRRLHELLITTDYFNVEVVDPAILVGEERSVDSFDVEDFDNGRNSFAINEVVDPAILVGEEGSVDSFDVEDVENGRNSFAINEVVDPAILGGKEGSIDSFDIEDFESARNSIPINEVVDPAILVGEGGSVVWQQLQAVLQLALICRKRDPEIRPDMVDVTKELRKIERFIL